MHLDPSTPGGLLDAAVHFAPLWGSATFSGALLWCARLFDRVRGGTNGR